MLPHRRRTLSTGVGLRSHILLRVQLARCEVICRLPSPAPSPSLRFFPSLFILLTVWYPFSSRIPSSSPCPQAWILRSLTATLSDSLSPPGLAPSHGLQVQRWKIFKVHLHGPLRHRKTHRTLRQVRDTLLVEGLRADMIRNLDRCRFALDSPRRHPGEIKCYLQPRGTSPETTEFRRSAQPSQRFGEPLRRALGIH